MKHQGRGRLVPRCPILTLHSCCLLEVEVAVSGRAVKGGANRFKNPSRRRHSLACLLDGHVRSAAVVPDLAQDDQFGVGTTERRLPATALDQIPVHSRFHSRMFREGSTFVYKQGPDCVEGGVGGPRNRGVGVFLTPVLGRLERASGALPEIGCLLIHRTTPSRLTFRYRAKSPASKRCSSTGRG